MVRRAWMPALPRIGARDVLVGVALTAAIVSGFVFESRPRSSRAGLLREVYASPVCLSGGVPRAGSPTIRQAWARTIGTPIADAKADFVGMTTVILYYSGSHLTFLHAVGHRWRFSDDLVTAAWVDRVCGPGTSNG
jgi:hypothetical protein